MRTLAATADLDEPEAETPKRKCKRTLEPGPGQARSGRSGNAQRGADDQEGADPGRPGGSCAGPGPASIADRRAGGHRGRAAPGARRAQRGSTRSAAARLDEAQKAAALAYNVFAKLKYIRMTASSNFGNVLSVLPLSPLAGYFKLQALPPAFYAWLWVILLGYCTLTTLMKHLYVRRYGWQ